MIDDQGGSLGGENDVEFKEQGGNGGRGRVVGGEGQENVAVFVDELEQICR